MVRPSSQAQEFRSRGGNRALARLRNPFEGPTILGTPQQAYGPPSPQAAAGMATPYGPSMSAPGSAQGMGLPPGAPYGAGTGGEGGMGASAGAATGTPALPGASEVAADAAAALAPSAAGADFGGIASTSGSGLFPMIGDQSPIGFRSLRSLATSEPGPPGPPNTPGPRGGSLFYPSIRNFKVTENMSPRPQDRVFYSFNYYDNVNATINAREQVPITNMKVYRNIWGIEKTFNEGKGSLGVRVPLSTVTADSPNRNISTPTSTAMSNLTIFGKYILEENRATGSLVSVGLAVTPPTAPGRFAGAPYLFGLNTTYIQPFVGYIWNRGRFYVQGFSAFDFPANPNDVTIMYNDAAIGYFVYRSDEASDLVTALAPTFEVHVNTPFNHRDPYNRFDIAGTPDVVNLTYGLNFELKKSAVLTTALVTPVTSPKPFDVEWALLLNIYYGRTRGNRLAMIPPVAP